MKRQESYSSDIISKVLNEDYDQRRQRNPRFSLRAYAKLLSIDPANLRKILKGEKAIGDEYQRKIKSFLGTHLQDVCQQLEDIKFKKVPAEVFKVISSWEYDALLEMLHLDDFKPKVKTIANKLNINESTCSEMVKSLEKVGMLKKEKSKWLDMSQDNSYTSANISTYSQKNYQIGLLKKSIDAIERIPKIKRSHSSLILAIDKSQLEEAKVEIKRFRRKMDEILKGKNNKRDDVYALSISLFSVLDEKKEKESVI